MKKVFLVTRKGKISYDEYDSCVIIADDIDEVNYLIDEKKDCWDKRGMNINYWDEGEDDREIDEIDLSTSKSIEMCSSFNAG